MATPSRVRMNKLRHKQGMISKEKQLGEEKEKSWQESNKEQITEEDHKKRLEMLKQIGLIK